MAAALDKLRKSAGRDLFLPLGFRLSLALEQVTWDEVIADPGLATFALRSGQRLLGADGLVNWFDTWLEAEGAGIAVTRDEFGDIIGADGTVDGPVDATAIVESEPVARVLEITRRLCAETGDQAAVLGCLTGGGTLLTRLLGRARAETLFGAFEAGSASKADRDLAEESARISVALADAYCTAGVSALVLAEAEPVTGTAHLKPFVPLFNLAGYYGVPVIMVSRAPMDAALADRIRAAGVTHVAAAGVADDRVRAVPRDLMADAPAAAAWLATQGGAPGSRLFLTDWDLPAEAKAEAVAALAKAIAG